MSLLRGLAARASLAVASVLPVRPTPAAVAPAAPAPLVDPASYLHVEVHVAAHRETRRRVTPEELAAAWQLAEEHWSEHYRGLPAELAENTRRALERRKAVST